MIRLVRITTVPVSLKLLLRGQMKYMQQKGFEVTMISAGGPEITDLEKQENCPHIIVPLSRKITPLQDIISLYKMVIVLRKIKPHIVHTHTPKAGLIGMCAAWLVGVPVRLHTVAGLPWMETKGTLRQLLKMLERLTVFFAHGVYPNSLALMSFLESEKIGKKKLKVIGAGSSNGIDSDFFSATESIKAAAEKLRKEAGVSEDDFVWIFVGRLVKDKGIGELLQAFTQLQEKFPGDQLWLTGDEEPQRDPLTAEQKNCIKSNKNIRCYGFQNDIRPYLAAAQALVFPSYREGFPNVPMQAGLMGCTLLLSDINGCNEIVTHEKEGLLFPVKNAKAVFECMISVRMNPEKRDALTTAAAKKIKEGYSQQKIWQLLANEYKFRLAEKKLAAEEKGNDLQEHR